VLVGNVRAVHVIPSVDDAATDDSRATAAKTPVVGLQVTENHFWLDGKVRVVQLIPSVDDAAVDET
jgi:hypothetical protein